MKKNYFPFIGLVLCLFSFTNISLSGSQNNGNNNSKEFFLFGPWIYTSNPVVSGGGGLYSIGIIDLKFNYQNSSSTVSVYHYTGDPDTPVNHGQVSYPTSITVRTYTEWDVNPMYIGVKDDNGNILSCQLIQYGTRTYTFQISSYSSSYTIYTSDQTC